MLSKGMPGGRRRIEGRSRVGQRCHLPQELAAGGTSGRMPTQGEGETDGKGLRLSLLSTAPHAPFPSSAPSLPVPSVCRCAAVASCGQPLSVSPRLTSPHGKEKDSNRQHTNDSRETRTEEGRETEKEREERERVRSLGFLACVLDHCDPPRAARLFRPPTAPLFGFSPHAAPRRHSGRLVACWRRAPHACNRGCVRDHCARSSFLRQQTRGKTHRGSCVRLLLPSVCPLPRVTTAPKPPYPLHTTVLVWCTHITLTLSLGDGAVASSLVPVRRGCGRRRR
jgi:hypothetical protein